MRSKRHEPAHAPRPTHRPTNRTRWRPLLATFCATAAVTCAVMLAIGTSGCGTTGGDVTAQTGSAAATTIFDLLITELVNAVADSFDNRPPPAQPADGNDGDNGNGGDDGAYAATCAGCHGADGSGPPDIRGLSEDDLSAGLQSGVHGSITVTDAELAEIVAFLGGDGEQPECTSDADCGEDQVCQDGECVAAPAPTPAETFPTSLHALRTGMGDTYYSADDGFVQLTGVPYDDLGCFKCHKNPLADGSEPTAAEYQPSCADCHADVSNITPVEESVCLGCHSRQGAERNIFEDVHRNKNLVCMDCHDETDVHGDGTEYASHLETRGPRCENCHVEGGEAPAPPSNGFHNLHLEDLDCSACHVQSVVTCYNCHFETEVAGVGKRWFGQAPRSGFKFLMNYDGKVYPASFQSLTYDGQSFVTFAPYYAHSVSPNPGENIACGDCHRQGGAGNAAAEEYNNDGQITVTAWDDEADGTARVIGPTGVIPIPPDWETALKLVYVNYTGEDDAEINGEVDTPLFEFLKETNDGSHIPYGEPLTDQQMDALINN